MKLGVVRLGIRRWNASYKRGGVIDGRHRYLCIDGWIWRVCLIWGGQD